MLAGKICFNLSIRPLRHTLSKYTFFCYISIRRHLIIIHNEDSTCTISLGILFTTAKLTTENQWANMDAAHQKLQPFSLFKYHRIIRRN